MICVNENKALLCKGDFRPAELYKGETKITGYEKTDVSGEGGITIESCYNDYLHNAQIKGNSVQNGTPTPDTPVEIQSVGEFVAEGDYAGKYKIPVTARGKNIYKPTRFATNNIPAQTTAARLENTHGTVINTTNAKAGEVIVTQTRVNREEDLLHYANGFFCIETGTQLIPGGKYTLSFDCEIIESPLNTNYMDIYPNNYTPAYRFSVINGRNSVDFTHNTTAGYNNFLHIRNAGKSLKISNVMITEQGYNSDYEPYIEPQTFDIYLDEPIRKAGIYYDYIDFEQKKILRNVTEEIFQGNEKWVLYNNAFSVEIKNTRSNYRDNMYSVAAICNRFKAVSGYDVYYAGYYFAEDFLVCCGLGSKGKQFSVIPASILPTVSEWKETLKHWNEEGNPMTAYHAMDTVEEEIELPKLPTFKGTTIYEISTQITANISGMYKKAEG